MTVYFIQAGENGPVKIGFTAGNAQRRMHDLQIGNPVKLCLLYVYDNQDKTLESELRSMFRHIKIRGEWFHPTRELMEYVETLQCSIPNIDSKRESPNLKEHPLRTYLDKT